MLAISRTCFGDTCPATDPAALVQKLTSISVGPIQPIDDQTAQGIVDQLISTVRCNTEDAAKAVIVPVVAFAGVAAVFAGVAALVAFGRASRPAR